ncbi:hypothetical protein [Acinetobacter johnsonii]|uniref:hypothetical protein n=1 Tax=Acinetobacter johnsonii TaxID=40214 RepID=UPI003AF8286A
MATDVDVQYFSHLNGLVLGNNWGDLIRLLDKALVTGVNFTQITAASIDAEGDVSITLFAAHNAMLFQVVELSGFTPNSLNQKYRIKGVPNTTQLILKPALDITERSITTMGTGKLASLGYDIIFRDTNDVKRVYRAKNPTAQHPFIRVDESLTSPDGTTGVYSSAYAKFAMVGLLEHMEHIDDFENPDVLQLPFAPADPAKNWKITGTGTSVVRGWARWYFAYEASASSSNPESSAPPNGGRAFTIVGDLNAFFLTRSKNLSGYENYTKMKYLVGCGLLNSNSDSTNTRDWFLISPLKANTPANSSQSLEYTFGGMPLLRNVADGRKFIMLKYSAINQLQAHVTAEGIVPDFASGVTGLYSASDIAALEIPVYDYDKFLRGTLRHIAYSGNSRNVKVTTPLLSGSSMYVYDSLDYHDSGYQYAGFYFYLGETE